MILTETQRAKVIAMVLESCEGSKAVRVTPLAIEVKLPTSFTPSGELLSSGWFYIGTPEYWLYRVMLDADQIPYGRTPPL